MLFNTSFKALFKASLKVLLKVYKDPHSLLLNTLNCLKIHFTELSNTVKTPSGLTFYILKLITFMTTHSFFSIIDDYRVIESFNLTLFKATLNTPVMEVTQMIIKINI